MAIRIWSSAALVAALLLPAGAGAQSPDPSVVPTLDTRIAIPDGRRLHVVCTGPELTPYPIVLFEADLGRQASTWAPVQDALPDDVRACAYDRPGTGSSERSTGPRTPDDEVADLHALLAAAAVPPPYVVVADGVGTWFAGAYATVHPHDVVGMVLVDPVSPTRDAALRAVLGEPVSGEDASVSLARDALDDVLTPPETTPGQVDLRLLSDRALRMVLGDRPLVVLEPTRATDIIGPAESPLRSPRGGVDPWRAAWDTIRDWGLTRSTRVTHRFVAGAEGIVERDPEAVVDGILDVIAVTGIDRAPGRAIARLRAPRSIRGERRTDRWIRIDDRSGTATSVGVSMRILRRREQARPAPTGGPSQPSVRVLGVDRTRIAISWVAVARDCEPEAVIMLDTQRMRVTLVRPGRATRCLGSGGVLDVVVQLRVPLPAGEPSIVAYRGLDSFLGVGPSRTVVELPSETGIDHVEIEDHNLDVIGARPLRVTDDPPRWRGDPDGVQTARHEGQLLVRWSTLPCVSWSRVAIMGDGSVTVADGAVPDCDAASAPRGVAIRFRDGVPFGPPAASVESLDGTTPVPDGALIRQQAEAAATSLSLVDYEVLGARLAQAAELDARLQPPDRWIWGIALRNPAGNDVCPDGITWDGLPCPNLSSLTVYLDAVTGELLGRVLGAF